MRALALLVLFALSVGAQANWSTQERAIMGTEVKITLWHADEAVGRKAMAAAMAEMQRIDQAYSPYIDTSELARINISAAKAATTISPEMALLLKRSQHFSELSNGAFDITFASLGWHYDYRQKQQPSDSQKQALLPAIDYRLIKLDPAVPSVRFMHPDVRIDLGGIAKGYAVDRAIAVLQDLGIAHATVSAGGDSRLLGDKVGRPWLIGIKNPRPAVQQSADVVLTMPLDNVAVSTSGDYERFFIDEQTGARVHHIINPKTGESARELISATVLGPVAMDTDALSTTVFVLGIERGLQLINQLVDFDCVLIDAEGRVHYSEGLVEPEM